MAGRGSQSERGRERAKNIFKIYGMFKGDSSETTFKGKSTTLIVSFSLLIIGSTTEPVKIVV